MYNTARARPRQHRGMAAATRTFHIQTFERRSM
jgi:hypothetical protein